MVLEFFRNCYLCLVSGCGLSAFSDPHYFTIWNLGLLERSGELSLLLTLSESYWMLNTVKNWTLSISVILSPALWFACLSWKMWLSIGTFHANILDFKATFKPAFLRIYTTKMESIGHKFSDFVLSSSITNHGFNLEENTIMMFICSLGERL